MLGKEGMVEAGIVSSFTLNSSNYTRLTKELENG